MGPRVIATIKIFCDRHDRATALIEFDKRWTRKRERELANVVIDAFDAGGNLDDAVLIDALNKQAQATLGTVVQGDVTGAKGLYPPFSAGTWIIGSDGLHEKTNVAHAMNNDDTEGVAWEFEYGTGPSKPKAMMSVQVRWTVGREV